MLDLIIPVATAAIASSLTAAYFQSVIRQHEICPIYKVFTRIALEKRWEKLRKQPDLAIAFLDIDKLKEANNLYGHEGANVKLSKSLQVLRSRDLLAGRFFSGDEFVIAASSHHILKPVNRLIKALKENNLSATVAITHCKSTDSLKDATSEAKSIVENLKNQNIRGVVVSKLSNESSNSNT